VFAEAAVPVVPGGAVLVLRAPLRDTLRDVDLVRRRLIVAGIAALGASLIAGYGLAWLFARRLRRLERAADRIASGRFDEPVVDTGRDEVGQLARAFDRMRTRLAGLERARREFIANASHELRTPIFSLGGFLELLDDEEMDEATRREFLTTAREQVARLTKLATDLLDLSRLDAGRVQLERAELDFARIARDLCEEFQAVARSGRHAIETAVEGTPRGVGDEQRTLQIGRILVENALVHTPPGTKVLVRAEQLDGRAVLAVEDAGPGIPAPQQPQVFDRFYRVDGGMASGSGLGLAIAKELAELMGGSIEVDSRPGSTTFRLALPAAG
jgi:signal transduction histidine kinase